MPMKSNNYLISIGYSTKYSTKVVNNIITSHCLIVIAHFLQIHLFSPFIVKFSLHFTSLSGYLSFHHLFQKMIFIDFHRCAIHVSLLRDLLRNEAYKCFLSPFFCLKSRENQTNLMTKNDPLAVTHVR